MKGLCSRAGLMEHLHVPLILCAHCTHYQPLAAPHSLAILIRSIKWLSLTDYWPIAVHRRAPTEDSASLSRSERTAFARMRRIEWTLLSAAACLLSLAYTWSIHLYSCHWRQVVFLECARARQKDIGWLMKAHTAAATHCLGGCLHCGLI